MPTSHFSRIVLAATFCAVLAAGLLTGISAQAQSPVTVYSFSEPPGPLNPNDQAITQGRDGELYLWAPGGSGNAACSVTYCGELFKISTSGTVTDLYDQTNESGGYNGNTSYGGLTLGTDGNFYGTTFYGGPSSTFSNNGTIFKMTPGGTVTGLYNFTGGSDGSHPYASPIEAASGTLYGTTSSASVADSTAYSITSTGTFKTIHTFTGADGQNIYAPLIQGTDGNFYGDTVAGGTSNNGVIFKMTATGTVTVLHNFAGTDGSAAYDPLIQASDGNFYGVAYSGGTSGAGVIFRITSAGTYTVLHNVNGTTDGTGPPRALVQATNGKLYGVTENVSNNGFTITGTIYSITTTGTFTTLYTFTNGTDGGYPLSPMVQHTNGLLYGTTNIGGNVNTCSTNVDGVIDLGCGVFFSLDIDAKPFIKLSSTLGKVGSAVGIFGQGFSSSSVVKFNGVQATTVKLSGTTFITATVPAGATDGFVTVTTGSTTLTSSQKYTVHNTWTSGAVMPTGVQWPMSATIGTKIYVVGGYTATAAIANNQIYNPTANTWSTGTAFPTAMAGGATAVVNNLLYIFGGSSNGGSTVTNAVWAYNPTTNAWTAKSAMPTARCSMTAVVEKGIVYVIGGFNGSRLNTVEAYNPTTDSWTTEASLLTGKSEISAGLIGTTIVAADGFTGGGETGDTEAYNATTNVWSALSSDPTARNGACAGVIGGSLYASDGNDGSNNAIVINESFTLASNKWTTLTSMPQAATDSGPAVYNGQLFCFGGSSFAHAFQGTVYNNVQIYQP